MTQPQAPTFPNPLLDAHRQAEAELQPYGPLEIVSTFGEPQAEYAAVRKAAGLFDLPHRGILELTGKDRLPFLNNLVSNVTWDKNAKQGMAASTGVYAFFLNLRGRIVADMNVLELGDRTLVETDVRYVDLLRKVWDLYLFTEKVTLASQVGKLHELALHGHNAFDVLRQAAGAPVPLDAPLASSQFKLFDVDAIAFRDDVCGVPGVHLVVPHDAAQNMWLALVERFGFATDIGKRMLRPIGWAAFNTTRIEAGRPLVDVDIPAATPDRPGAKLRPEELQEASQENAPTAGGGRSGAAPAHPGILPAETGPLAARAVAYTKCYVGQEIVARMHARGQVAKQLVGLRVADDALPVAGTNVFDDKDNAVGAVTSSTPSPVLSNATIALAYVKRPLFAEGTKLRVPAEGAVREATVVKLPFV